MKIRMKQKEKLKRQYEKVFDVGNSTTNKKASFPIE